jgi:hypothetical protein
MAVNLRNPGRTLHMGVVLFNGYVVNTCDILQTRFPHVNITSLTEILDIAPVDFFHRLTKSFLKGLPVPEEMRSQGLDIEFYWVTTDGKPARLTTGITMEATVRRAHASVISVAFSSNHRPLSPLVHCLTSSSWAPCGATNLTSRASNSCARPTRNARPS